MRRVPTPKVKPQTVAKGETQLKNRHGIVPRHRHHLAAAASYAPDAAPGAVVTASRTYLRQRGPRSPAATATPGGPTEQPQLSLAQQSARNKLLTLLDREGSKALGLYGSSPEIAAAVEDLIKENPSLTPGFDTPEVGVGVWEVFHAPHITGISSAMGTRFEPIRYSLAPGGAFSSNVRFSNPVLGVGWLSASGTLVAEDEGAVRVTFLDFWVDLGEAPRERAPAPGAAAPGGRVPAWVDPLVESLGRALFLPQLSLFPVMYLDPELSVFQFKPLSSNIAVRRVKGA